MRRVRSESSFSRACFFLSCSGLFISQARWPTFGLFLFSSQWLVVDRDEHSGHRVVGLDIKACLRAFRALLARAEHVLDVSAVGGGELLRHGLPDQVVGRNLESLLVLSARVRAPQAAARSTTATCCGLILPKRGSSVHVSVAIAPKGLQSEASGRLDARTLACRLFLVLGIVDWSDAAVLYLPSQSLGGAVSVSKGESMSAPLSADLAQIGKSVVIKGELSGSEDLYVDGQVEGSIALKGNSLTVGPHGQVKASVEAKGVIVQGKLEGNVQASDRVELRKTAVVTGDIATQRIAIEEGAYLKGKVDIQGKAEKAAGK